MGSGAGCSSAVLTRWHPTAENPKPLGHHRFEGRKTISIGYIICTSTIQSGRGPTSFTGLGFMKQMNEVCNRSMDLGLWGHANTSCCNRDLIGTAMQPHVVLTPAPALLVPTSLPGIHLWAALSTALCLIKIKSLLHRLQSATTSKGRLVKQHDYLQT